MEREITSMGGDFNNALLKNTTHLIANRKDGIKYEKSLQIIRYVSCSDVIMTFVAN